MQLFVARFLGTNFRLTANSVRCADLLPPAVVFIRTVVTAAGKLAEQPAHRDAGVFRQESQLVTGRESGAVFPMTPRHSRYAEFCGGGFRFFAVPFPPCSQRSRQARTCQIHCSIICVIASQWPCAQTKGGALTYAPEQARACLEGTLSARPLRGALLALSFSSNFARFVLDSSRSYANLDLVIG